MDRVRQVQYNKICPPFQNDGNTCQYCHAVKWNMEPVGMCCKSGKVTPVAYPPHPRVIQNLWAGDDFEAVSESVHDR